jgi:hypothetical protein
MVVHLDAGPDKNDRPREVILVIDARANVLEIGDPLEAPPDLPLLGPIQTTARQFHELRREKQRGNPKVQERRRSGDRWRNRADPGLRVSLGDLVGDAMRGGRR